MLGVGVAVLGWGVVRVEGAESGQLVGDLLLPEYRSHQGH